MKKARPVITLGLLLGAAVLCSSCSNKGLNPVQGKVLVNGSPAKGAIVIFHPKAGEDMHTVVPSGVAGEDGSFTLGSGKNDGAAAGDYVVTVTWPEERPAKITMEQPPPPPDRLKGRYADRTKSTLTATVKSGPNQLEPFDLR